jgi:SAM-dependent methyltransferase
VTADKERVWWDDADDADIFGEPPYDVEEVAKRIIDAVAFEDDHARVVDLGCGPGRLANHIATTLGDRVRIYGVDISQPLLFRAVVDSPGNAYYWRCDGRNIPTFPVRGFDAAYSITLFQHIPEDAMWGYINQVHDLLVPGGTFIFTLAHGDVDMFLNHQTRSLVKFGNDLSLIFDKVSVDHTPDANGWYWVTARKEAR